MTTASAQDRVEQRRLILREAEILREAAEQNYLKCYADFLEAKTLARPGLDVECFDERSVAERVADGWRQRGDVEVLP